MAAAIRDFDWSMTPLGHIDGWPPVLKALVGTIVDSDFPTAIVWGEDLTTIYNDAFRPILGNKRETLGRSFADIWTEAWPTIGPIVQRTLDGQSTFIEDFPLEVLRQDFWEKAYFTFSYSPIRDENGKVVGLMDTVIETTQSVTSRQSEQVLRRELVHRVKNMLAVTSSVINSSLKYAETIEDARDTIGRRIDALARAQSSLAEEQGITDIHELIHKAISPLVVDWSRVRLSGPHVDLEPQQVVALSLALYELTTNATKYGSLSSATGAVDINWSIGERESIAFTWKETGGPTVLAPLRSGFGSRLTGRIVSAYFHGTATSKFEPGGLVYELRGYLKPAGA